MEWKLWTGKCSCLKLGQVKHDHFTVSVTKKNDNVSYKKAKEENNLFYVHAKTPYKNL